jgi:hypothetical protein
VQLRKPRLRIRLSFEHIPDTVDEKHGSSLAILSDCRFRTHLYIVAHSMATRPPEHFKGSDILR